MFVVTATSPVILVIGLSAHAWQGRQLVLLYAAAILAASAPLFRRGLQLYSQAFVASIYEGFFSWLTEHRAISKSRPNDDMAKPA
jgi:hypothetical protein